MFRWPFRFTMPPPTGCQWNAHQLSMKMQLYSAHRFQLSRMRCNLISTALYWRPIGCRNGHCGGGARTGPEASYRALSTQQPTHAITLQSHVGSARVTAARDGRWYWQKDRSTVGLTAAGTSKPLKNVAEYPPGHQFHTLWTKIFAKGYDRLPANDVRVRSCSVVFGQKKKGFAGRAVRPTALKIQKNVQDIKCVELIGVHNCYLDIVNLWNFEPKK